MSGEAEAEDYIQRVVDNAPPLTFDQRVRLGAIFSGDINLLPPQRKPSRQEIERAENAERMKRLTRALAGCGICGVPDVAHHKGMHVFEPLDAKQIAQVYERIVGS